MSPRWPEVSLGEVLVQFKEFISEPEPREYPKLSVRLYGRGVTLDTPADGSTLRMKRHQVARAGQVILSEIWGKKGAIGFVPKDGHGALCTSHFFLFNVVQERLDPGWLRAIFRANYLAGQLDERAFGTTGYAAVRPKDLLACRIPLPPMPEQRRIVAKIERVAAKVGKVSSLREAVDREITALLRSESQHIFASLAQHRIHRLHEVCSEIVDCLHSNPIYAEGGVPTVRSSDVEWGRLDLANALTTSEEEYSRRTRRSAPRPGDIIVVREGGGTGKAGIVEEGHRLSLGQRVMQLRPDLRLVDPRFLLHQWLSPAVQEGHIAPLTKGSASPHLNIRAIRDFPLVVPGLEEQWQVVRYLDALRDKVDCLTATESEIAEELKVMMPAILDRAFNGEI